MRLRKSNCFRIYKKTKIVCLLVDVIRSNNFLLECGSFYFNRVQSFIASSFFPKRTRSQDRDLRCYRFGVGYCVIVLFFVLLARRLKTKFSKACAFFRKSGQQQLMKTNINYKMSVAVFWKNAARKRDEEFFGSRHQWKSGRRGLVKLTNPSLCCENGVSF